MTDEIFFGDRIQKKEYQISHLEATDKEYYTFVAIGLDDNGKMEVKVSFTYPRVTSQEQEQHLFLSADYSRLLDLRNDEATIYKLERGYQSKIATVNYEGLVSRIPFNTFDRDYYQLFCLFSPDFSKHFDIDASQK